MAWHFPDRFDGGPQSHEPLFRWANGSAITRMDICRWLERAALAQGVPAERVGSHSLRIGGATALYNQFKDIELVKRFGRWRLLFEQSLETIRRFVYACVGSCWSGVNQA